MLVKKRKEEEKRRKKKKRARMEEEKKVCPFWLVSIGSISEMVMSEKEVKRKLN